MNDFGLKIRKLRKAKNFTQETLGKKLGVTKSVISAYESNIRFPSYDILIKIAHLFGVSTDYLLGIQNNKVINADALDDKDYQLIVSLIDSLRLKNTK